MTQRRRIRAGDQPRGASQRTRGSVSGYGIPASNGLATATPQPLASGSIVPAVLLRDMTDEVLRPVLMPATNPLTIACVQP